jgi:uncharacterized membrane protein YfcA
VDAPAKENFLRKASFVIDFFPDTATFAAAIADPRFPLAVAISALAGVVRGFSGFGSALVYVPLMSALYGPRIAAPSMAVIDVLTAVAFVLTVWRQAVWREVLPLAASALLAAQFGSLILKYADPIWLRWFISLLVLAVVAVLASGWRYHGRPVLIVTLGVGALSGLLGSAVQMAGPPVIVYWLGSASDAVIVRANFIAYFATRNRVGSDLFAQGPADARSHRARAIDRTVADHVAACRHAAFPPGVGPDLSHSCLWRDPARGAHQHAAARRAVPLRRNYAPSFCISTSETSKLA